MCFTEDLFHLIKAAILLLTSSSLAVIWILFTGTGFSSTTLQSEKSNGGRLFMIFLIVLVLPEKANNFILIKKNTLCLVSQETIITTLYFRLENSYLQTDAPNYINRSTTSSYLFPHLHSAFAFHMESSVEYFSFFQIGTSFFNASIA